MLLNGDIFFYYILPLYAAYNFIDISMQTLDENSIVVSALSRALQQIISDTYQRRTPKASSTLHNQLQASLNQIQDKIDFYRSGQPTQIDPIHQQRQSDQQSQYSLLMAQNEEMKNQLKQGSLQRQAIVQQKLGLQHELALQRKQSLQQSLKIKALYLEELKLKDIKFTAELNTIKEAIQPKILDEDINLDDFKSLINKLNQENKLLKQQREQLLAQLDHPHNRTQTIPVQNDTNNAERDLHAVQPLLQIQSPQETIYRNQTTEDANRRYRKEQQNELKYITNDRQGQQQRMRELQKLRKLDQQAVKSLSRAISQLTNKVSNNMESVIDGPEISIQSLEERVKGLQAKVIASVQQNYQLKTRLSDKQEQTQRLQNNVQSATVKIISLQSSLRRKEGEVNEERATSANLSSIITDNNSYIQQLAKDNQQMQEKLNQRNTEIFNMTALIKQKEQEIEQLSSQHHHQRIQNQQSLTQSRRGLTQLEATVEQFQAKLQAKDKQIELATKQKAERLSQAEIQLNDKARKIKRLQEAVAQCEQKLLISENKYKDLVLSIDFRQRHPQESDTLALFPGQLLQDQPQYKLFLRQTLQKRAGKTIRRTKVIYKLDPLNKINFHAYIDNHEQIVLIVRLANGYFVAAYSQGKILPKTVSTKDGLIISLTNRQVFQPLEKNRRVVTYDEFFVIIGNSEFRLRSQEAKFFSNFGIANGYFKTRGKKVDVLTGTLQREVDMNALQVHQIQFL